MIKKIIGAVSLFITFIVTFAIGVGCIVRGAGDFSWDTVSEYVSLSDIVMINDTPISNVFSFSDHSSIVGSHAEGQIACPTNDGKIEIINIPAQMAVVASEDEFIHFTFDGEVRESCVMDSVSNLTGTNVPYINFSYNESTDKATIEIKRLRAAKNAELRITVAIPADYAGELWLTDIAGRVETGVPLRLTGLTAKDVAGKVAFDGVSAQELKLTDTAGSISMTDGTFEHVFVNDSAGKVEISGSVGYFEIDDIAGSVSIESDTYIAADCKISDVMGKVDIVLPTGSLINVTKSDIMGIVTASNTDASAEHTIRVSDVMGKVSIDN